MATLTHCEQPWQIEQVHFWIIEIGTYLPIVQLRAALFCSVAEHLG
jgi:hypothetical protein